MNIRFFTSNRNFRTVS